MSRPVVTAISPGSIDDFKTLDEVVFIGYISAEDDNARQSLTAVAQKYRQEFTFALVSDEAFIKAENMESPTVVCHVIEDDKTRLFSPFSEPESVDKFVSEASRRVIGELTSQNQQRLLEVSTTPRVRLIASDTSFRSAVGLWYTFLERLKSTALSFVGHFMTSQRATTTL